MRPSADAAFAFLFIWPWARAQAPVADPGGAHNWAAFRSERMSDTRGRPCNRFVSNASRPVVRCEHESWEPIPVAHRSDRAVLYAHSASPFCLALGPVNVESTPAVGENWHKLVFPDGCPLFLANFQST